MTKSTCKERAGSEESEELPNCTHVGAEAKASASKRKRKAKAKAKKKTKKKRTKAGATASPTTVEPARKGKKDKKVQTRKGANVPASSGSTAQSPLERKRRPKKRDKAHHEMDNPPPTLQARGGPWSTLPNRAKREP